jgi:hypothetical protein
MHRNSACPDAPISSWQTLFPTRLLQEQHHIGTGFSYCSAVVRGNELLRQFERATR